MKIFAAGRGDICQDFTLVSVLTEDNLISNATYSTEYRRCCYLMSRIWFAWFWVYVDCVELFRVMCLWILTVPVWLPLDEIYKQSSFVETWTMPFARLLTTKCLHSYRSIPKTGYTTTRHLHRTTAEFTHRNPNGQLLNRQENIWIGDPGDAFVMVPVEFEDVFSVCCIGFV